MSFWNELCELDADPTELFEEFALLWLEEAEEAPLDALELLLNVLFPPPLVEEFELLLLLLLLEFPPDCWLFEADELLLWLLAFCCWEPLELSLALAW